MLCVICSLTKVDAIPVDPSLLTRVFVVAKYNRPASSFTPWQET